MSRLLKALLSGCVFISACLPLAAQSYVLELAPGTDVNVLAAKYSFTVVKSFQSLEGISYSISTAKSLTSTVLTQLAAEPGVREVESNSSIPSIETSTAAKVAKALEPLGNLLSSPTPVTYYGNTVLGTYVNQPGTQLIELAGAHASYGAGAGTVAIIDTGVDTAHPALAGALVPGYDFTRDRPDTVSELNDLNSTMSAALSQSTVELLDSKKIMVALAQSTVEILDQSTVEILDGGKLPSFFGHGTMTAGLVHLVAPNAKIMPLKAFAADGSASIYDIDRAIRYAADHGANVISMSFEFRNQSPILQAAVAYAQSRGVIAVASAGNDGREMAVYPAAYSGVIGVGSTNFSDLRSLFSNWGDSTRAMAPGEALVTLYPGGNYAAVWGTSFSAPLVSGAVAMMAPIYTRGNLDYSVVINALNHGVHINEDTSRLDLVPTMNYCLRSYTEH